jgi:hypothetical protein
MHEWCNKVRYAPRCSFCPLLLDRWMCLYHMDDCFGMNTVIMSLNIIVFVYCLLIFHCHVKIYIGLPFQLMNIPFEALVHMLDNCVSLIMNVEEQPSCIHWLHHWIEVTSLWSL